MTKRISAILLCLALLMFASVACAQKYNIVAEGSYTVGDRDTREVAKKHAVQDAMRIAVEKAGVYVESYSETQNYQLTQDQVRTIAAGVVKVLDESIDFVDNGNICRATIYASVDTSDIDLERLMTTYTVSNGRTYRKKQPSSPSSSYSAAPKHRRVTALVINYAAFSSQYRHILPLGSNDCIKSEDGTIVYDKAIGNVGLGDLCYQDSNVARVMARAGSNPIIVEPIYFERDEGYDYYWTNPVLKKEDADYILEMNDEDQFLERGEVYIIDVG